MSWYNFNGMKPKKIQNEEGKPGSTRLDCHCNLLLMACQTFHKLFISFSLSNGKAHLASKNKTSQITQFYGFLKTRKMCKLN